MNYKFPKVNKHSKAIRKESKLKKAAAPKFKKARMSTSNNKLEDPLFTELDDRKRVQSEKIGEEPIS